MQPTAKPLEQATNYLRDRAKAYTASDHESDPLMACIEIRRASDGSFVGLLDRQPSGAFEIFHGKDSKGSLGVRYDLNEALFILISADTEAQAAEMPRFAVVRLTAQGVNRVLAGAVDMTFIVDKVTAGLQGPVAHVRDYRYGKTDKHRGFQTWSLITGDYEVVG